MSGVLVSVEWLMGCRLRRSFLHLCNSGTKIRTVLANGSPSMGETRKLKWKFGRNLGRNLSVSLSEVGTGDLLSNYGMRAAPMQRGKQMHLRPRDDVRQLNVSALNRTYLLFCSSLNRASFTSIDPKEVDYSTRHENIRSPESGGLGRPRCPGARPQLCPCTKRAGLCA